jgi:hypothetical protein
LRTLATCFGAQLHLAVWIVVSFAQRSASIADFSTLSTKMRVMRRPTAHEVGRDRANLSTVKQRNKVLCFGMMSTSVKHMRNGFHAHLVTLQTILQAVGKCIVHLFHVVSPKNQSEIGYEKPLQQLNCNQTC